MLGRNLYIKFDLVLCPPKMMKKLHVLDMHVEFYIKFVNYANNKHLYVHKSTWKHSWRQMSTTKKYIATRNTAKKLYIALIEPM